MRSLTRNNRDDRGAVLVWVAFMIVALLGAGALVIDVGALRVERRELQNGADAAALAVAKDCVPSDTVPKGDCKDGANAEPYADQNANDDAANVDNVCGSGLNLDPCPPGVSLPNGALGWVRVETSTHNPANADHNTHVKFLLAPVLDAVGETVEASAVAAWGRTGKARTLPVAFSVCEYRNLGGKLDGSVFPLGKNYIYLHGADPAPDGAGYEDCPNSPSGQDVPGGFGWLFADAECRATVTYDKFIDGSTGRDEPCDLGFELEEEVLIPLYDEVQYQGAHASYHIVGYVGLKVLGYKFQNDYEPKTGPDSMKFCGTQDGTGKMAGNVDCVYGEFTRMSITGDDFGGGTNYGATSVAMFG